MLSELRPRGEVATLDCPYQSGEDGTEEGTMEEGSEISFNCLGTDGTRGD